MKKDWHIYALTALAIIAWWFAKAEIEGNKAQNIHQWQEAAKTKDCLKDEISRLRERVAHLEGYHKYESECKEKKP